MKTSHELDGVKQSCFLRVLGFVRSGIYYLIQHHEKMIDPSRLILEAFVDMSGLMQSARKTLHPRTPQELNMCKSLASNFHRNLLSRA